MAMRSSAGISSSISYTIGVSVLASNQVLEKIFMALVLVIASGCFFFTKHVVEPRPNARAVPSPPPCPTRLLFRYREPLKWTSRIELLLARYSSAVLIVDVGFLHRLRKHRGDHGLCTAGGKVAGEVSGAESMGPLAPLGPS